MASSSETTFPNDDNECVSSFLKIKKINKIDSGSQQDSFMGHLIGWLFIVGN